MKTFKTREVSTKTPTELSAPASAGVTPGELRARALYASAHGPLLAWLSEEARARGDTAAVMCKHLGVTFGYIAQLRSGHRKLSGISDQFATQCAKYLGVPTIVVKLLAERVTLQDFAIPELSDEDLLRQAVRRMRAHPRACEMMAVDPEGLPLDAQRMLVLAFGAAVGEDLFAQPQLPSIIRSLKSASALHEEHKALTLSAA